MFLLHPVSAVTVSAHLLSYKMCFVNKYPFFGNFYSDKNFCVCITNLSDKRGLLAAYQSQDEGSLPLLSLLNCIES